MSDETIFYDVHGKIKAIIGRESVADAFTRLQAENAAMREIVEAVAGRAWYTHSSTLGGDWQQYACCPFEECEQESLEGSRNIRHTPDCPVTKARALLGREGEAR